MPSLVNVLSRYPSIADNMHRERGTLACSTPHFVPFVPLHHALLRIRLHWPFDALTSFPTRAQSITQRGIMRRKCITDEFWAGPGGGGIGSRNRFYTQTTQNHARILPSTVVRLPLNSRSAVCISPDAPLPIVTGLILAYGVIVIVGGTRDLAGAAGGGDRSNDWLGDPDNGVFPPIVGLLAQLTVTMFGLVSVFLGFQVCVRAYGARLSSTICQRREPYNHVEVYSRKTIRMFSLEH